MSQPLVITPAFGEALERLERGENLFLTGKAGTGKSTLIRHFLATTSRRALVAAPTGIAALNVGGYTLHRLFSFGTGITVEYARSQQYYPGRFAGALRELETLIIDEASMVRADLLDCIEAALTRFGPHPGAPFGGVQIVLVGDLFQLPPVVTDSEARYFSQAYESPYFFSAACYSADAFPMVNLSRVFRQVGDSQLIEILNGVRDGALRPADRALLNTHTDPTFRPPLGEFWLTLTTTNRIAKARNREMLEQIPLPELRHEAVTTGTLDNFEAPTERELVYKVGAQVMMLTNDPSDRWVNGSIGKIADWRREEGAVVVTVEFSNGSRAEVAAHQWDVTRPVIASGMLDHEIVGTFTQLPFRLAWAITIHKSQGQTLERMVVDLTGGTFSDGQLYVALSRCTSLAGLVLRRDVLPKDLKVDQRVRRFLRSGGKQTEARGIAYLGACWVGDAGSRWRPRPIEIAFATDDGAEWSTLINPSRDLGSARADFDLSTTDIELAPALADAWPALCSTLSGYALAGADIDTALGYLDFELKRGGLVCQLPIGIEMSQELSGADRIAIPRTKALDQARFLRDLGLRRQLSHTGADPVAPLAGRAGYLFPRWHDCADFAVVTPEDAPASQLVDCLRQAITRAPLSPRNRPIISGLEEALATTFADAIYADDGATSVDHVFSPGARVCFTGTVITDSGHQLEREEMMEMAAECGLAPVKTVTKTRCDALVAAEVTSLSGKAKKARAWGKPVIGAREFLAWAVAHGSEAARAVSSYAVSSYAAPAHAGSTPPSTLPAEDAAPISVRVHQLLTSAPGDSLLEQEGAAV